MLNKSTLFTAIEKVVSGFNFEEITAQRKDILQSLIDFIQLKIDNQEDVRLNFICTHNSRRSHLSQIWAQTASYYYGVKNVHCYSGGTEVTAMFPKVAETLANTGFKVQKLSEGNNPVYAIKFAQNQSPIIGFSKKYDDEFNPETSYAAIMTCSQADEGCPFIAGAEKRIAITFDDPKVFDNTPLQALKYEERSLQIACEMFYVFSLIRR